MVAKIPDENPIKSLLVAIEHLDAYATAYRYPSPRGRVKAGPTPAELDRDLGNLQRAFDEIVRRFRIDIAAVDTPAGDPGPIR